MVVQAIGVRAKRNELPEAPQLDVARPLDPVAPANYSSADTTHRPTDPGGFRAMLHVQREQKTSGASFRIGAGFYLPKSVSDRIAKALEDLTPSTAKSYSELRGDVKDAVKAELKKHAPNSAEYKEIVRLATSDAFLQQSPAVQKAIVNNASAQPKDATYRKEFLQLVNDADFRSLPETEKLALIDGFARHGADPAARGLISRLATSSEFPAVGARQRNDIISHITVRGYYGDEARAQMKRVIDHPGYKTDEHGAPRTKEFQARTLEQVSDDNLFRPRIVDFEPEDIAGKERPYKKSRPVELDHHSWTNSNSAAIKYDITIDGQTIPVYIAQKQTKGMKALTIDQIADALAAMPKEARAFIKRVEMNPYVHNDDRGKGVDNNDRAFMTAGSAGIVRIYPTPDVASKESVAGTMVHESGHTASRRAWGDDTDGKGWDKWRAAMQKDGPAPSRYGDTNPDEDFGETWQLYFEVRGTDEEAAARESFPERFKLIDELLAAKS